MPKGAALAAAYLAYLTTNDADALCTALLRSARIFVNRYAPASLDRDDLTSVVTTAMWRKLSRDPVEPKRLIPTLVCITRRKIADAWRKHYRQAASPLTGDVYGAEQGQERIADLYTLPSPLRGTVDALQNSSSVADAAGYAGVSRRTMQRRIGQLRKSAGKLEVSRHG